MSNKSTELVDITFTVQQYMNSSSHHDKLIEQEHTLQRGENIIKFPQYGQNYLLVSKIKNQKSLQKVKPRKLVWKWKPHDD